MRLADDFQGGLNPAWSVTQTGAGVVTPERGLLRLTDEPTPAGHYTNAQISDYDYRSYAMRWSPLLRMQVTAQASAADGLRGTAGFGFWNHPAGPGRVRLPKACWFFFGSLPGGLNLAYGVPGPGWKAMTLDLTRRRALALAPFALPVVLLNQLPALYRRIWPRLQRPLSISEQALDVALLDTPHTYMIEWRRDGVIFSVDGATVHEAPVSPGGPMGFIAWVDNQYMRVSPQGRFAWGVLPLETPQSLLLHEVVVEAG
jgi:hypothetical protein